MEFNWLNVGSTERDQNPISGRRELLLALLRSNPPENIDKETIISVLSTQRGLAKLSCETLSVRPMSLNTLKKSASGNKSSWAQLDALRLRVVNELRRPIEVPMEPPRRTIAWYKKRMEELEEKLAIAQEDLVVLTRAFDRAFTNARSIARKSGDARLMAIWTSEEDAIRNELAYMNRHKGTPGD